MRMASVDRIWFVVVNGSRGRAFERRQDQPGYDVVAEWDAPDARARDADLGEDRPGRAFSSVGARRSGMEHDGVDDSPKEHARRDHLHMVADTLGKARGVKGFVLVAPDRVLPELRNNLAAVKRDAVLAETQGDWTQLPMAEIFQRLDALRLGAVTARS